MVCPNMIHIMVITRIPWMHEKTSDVRSLNTQSMFRFIEKVSMNWDIFDDLSSITAFLSRNVAISVTSKVKLKIVL